MADAPHPDLSDQDGGKPAVETTIGSANSKWCVVLGALYKFRPFVGSLLVRFVVHTVGNTYGVWLWVDLPGSLRGR